MRDRIQAVYRLHRYYSGVREVPRPVLSSGISVPADTNRYKTVGKLLPAQHDFRRSFQRAAGISIVPSRPM